MGAPAFLIWDWGLNCRTGTLYPEHLRGAACPRVLRRYRTRQTRVYVPLRTPTRYGKTWLLYGISFLPQNLGTTLGGFIHEKTHFRMGRFDVRREPELAQSLGSRWPDRCNQHVRKSAAHSLFLIHFSRNLKEVIHLYRCREQDNVEFIARDCRDRGTQ